MARSSRWTALVILLAALWSRAALAQTPAPTDPDATEWIGGEIGLLQIGRDLGLGGSIRIVTIRWPRFAWSIADITLGAGFKRILSTEADADGRVRVEATVASFHTTPAWVLPMNLARTRQLVFGLGIGATVREEEEGATGSARTSFSLAPTLRYVAALNTMFVLGAGIKAIVPVAGSWPAGHYPFQLLVSVSFGWTPGPLIASLF